MGEQMNITFTDLMVTLIVACLISFGLGYATGNLERYRDHCYQPTKSIEQMNKEMLACNPKLEKVVNQKEK